MKRKRKTIVISKNMALLIFRVVTRVMVGGRVYDDKYQKAKEIREYMKKKLF